MKNLRISAIVILCLVVMRVRGQATGSIPKIISGNGRHALLVDGKPFFILGAQAHNSSAWPAMLPQLWKAVKDLHANTLEVPVYWEQLEPKQGRFDFSLIDTMLAQASQQQVHLILLWFATWKNGSNHYVPAWMKQDAARYPNIKNKEGRWIDSPSPHAEATKQADIKAFVSMMNHLKEADPQRVVIMVQIENESGAWGSVRDFSPAAQKLFEKPVPAEMLNPELLNALQVPPVKTGNWQTVFGKRADEYFQAWSVAHFIGEVAAAGKSVYALPMYVNAALRDPFTNPMANEYESGGPTDNVIPIWKTAAPAVDLLAPDIYLSGTDTIMKVIDLYSQKDNVLFVPELGWSGERVKYLYEVIAHGGIGFSPFGLDDNGRDFTSAEMQEHLEPFAREYKVLEPMMRKMAAWSFDGKIKSVVERENHADQTIDLGKWEAIISFGDGERKASEKINKPPNGKAMFIQLEENKFLVIGTLCHISFRPLGENNDRPWQYLKVEEGKYEKDVFVPWRILNGDETDFGGPHFGIKPVVLMTELILR